MVWAVGLLGWVVATGCGSRAHDNELRQMRKAVDQLRAQLARYDAKVESLADELVVLSERVQAVRGALDGPSVPSDLRVVRLSPPKAAASGKRTGGAGTPGGAGAGDPHETGDGEPLEIVMGDDGELRVRGDQEPAAGASDGAHVAGRELFSRALKAFRHGEPDAALTLFEMFLVRYPDHAYVANALYWVGECRFEQGMYDAAAEALARLVTAYPSSGKVPDALLKLGLAHERASRVADARRAFSDLIAAYPRSALADVARNHLSDTEGRGMRP